MAKYAVVNDSDNVIVNVVEWDGEAQWSPPAGTQPVLDENGEAKIGGTYDGEFHDP